MKDGYGNTPLYYAVANNNFKIVEVLMTSPILLNNHSNIPTMEIKASALQCYLDSDTNLYKKFRERHLFNLKQYIAMKGKCGRAALELAQKGSMDEVFMYLTKINSAEKYDDLDEDIKKLTDENYKKQLAPSDYWVNKERALCMPLVSLNN